MSERPCAHCGVAVEQPRTGWRKWCSPRCKRAAAYAETFHDCGANPFNRVLCLDILEGREYEVDPDGCWIWQRKISAFGYGVIRHRERTLQAHRVMYELAVGPIPPGMQIHHRCRVKACVNPEHLTVISPTEHHRIPNGQVKLTWERVREIRERHAAGETMAALGPAFGVDPSNISRIVRHELWASPAP